MPEKLKKIFEKTYTGKKVPKKYRKKYGEFYDKEEADEVFYSWLNKRK